jgi:hypothetical protein
MNRKMLSIPVLGTLIAAPAFAGKKLKRILCSGNRPRTTRAS